MKRDLIKMFIKILKRIKWTILSLFKSNKTPILHQYIMNIPNKQDTIDIFKNEWSSKFPEESNIIAGNVELFNDKRILWALELFGDVDGKDILELGPLEAGHTYMLHNKNVKSILSIEANTRAFLKCLIVKEIFQLNRAIFICGDFIKFLKSSDNLYDYTIASGILYHMTNPVELIELISKTTSKAVFVWTHYYDKNLIDAHLKYKFVSSESNSYHGFNHTIYKQFYLGALGWQGFCGGGQNYSYWLEKQDIIDAFKYFGFSKIDIGFDDEKHPNGPAFAFVAYK